MFDENKVPLGQRYDFSCGAQTRLSTGRLSERSQKARLPTGGVWSLGRGRASMRPTQLPCPLRSILGYAPMGGGREVSDESIG